MALSLVFFVGAFAMCALLCCENARFYMSFAPWALILGAMSLQGVLRSVQGAPCFGPHVDLS